MKDLKKADPEFSQALLHFDQSFQNREALLTRQNDLAIF